MGSSPLKTATPSKTFNFNVVKELGTKFKKLTGEKKSEIVRHYKYHSDAIWDVQCVPTYSTDTDLNLFASASADGNVCFWTQNLVNPILVYSGHSGSVNCIRFHPTKTLALSASGDKTCQIWKFKNSINQESDTIDDNSNPQENKLQTRLSYLKRFEDNTENDVLTQDMLDSEELNSDVHSNDDNEFKESKQFEGNKPVHVHQNLNEIKHNDAVIGCEWMNDGCTIVTACWDSNCRIYKLTDSGVQHVGDLSGHTGRLNGVSCARQSGLIVSYGIDETIRLWDSEQKNSLHILKGHSASVSSVVFAPGDRFIVSGSDDGIMKIWDLKNTKSPLKTVHTHSGVNKISISNYHSRICVGMNKRQIKIYDLSGSRLHTLQDKRVIIYFIYFTNFFRDISL